MDIRYRCRTIAEQAPVRQKLRFYQARYDRNRLRQILCFLRILAAGSTGSRCGNAFVDYRSRQVFDFDSVGKELQRYDVISFDVFDTLICRTVQQPADIFRILEQQTGIPEFAVYRIEAEKAARQLRYASYYAAGEAAGEVTGKFTREVTIEEIYRVMLYDKRFLTRSMECGAILQTQKLSDWIHAEMEIEKQCCRADLLMQKLVCQLLAQKKRVIAVSDMYLHQTQVLELLHRCGYADLKEIYVSCDYRAGKSDGRLFPLIRKRIGPDRQLIHIGDNFYADVCRPQESGIRTLHYITERKKRFA